MSSPPMIIGVVPHWSVAPSVTVCGPNGFWISIGCASTPGPEATLIAVWLAVPMSQVGPPVPAAPSTCGGWPAPTMLSTPGLHVPGPNAEAPTGVLFAGSWGELDWSTGDGL